MTCNGPGCCLEGNCFQLQQRPVQMTTPTCTAVSQCAPKILKMATPLRPHVNQRAHALREIILIKATVSKQVGQRLHYFRVKTNCKQDKWPPAGRVLSSRVTSHTGDKDTVLIAAWTSILSSLCGDTSEARWVPSESS